MLLLIMPLVYCDHNFIINAYESPPKYHDRLRESITLGRATLVLSSWHWLEMARDKDHHRGRDIANFCDSLNSLWLHDRVIIQRGEVEEAFFKSIGVSYIKSPVWGSLAEIIAERSGASTRKAVGISTSQLVEHMQSLGRDHPLEVALRENFEKQKQNRASYKRGEATPAKTKEMDEAYIRGLLPRQTPAGLLIDQGSKRRFLQVSQGDDFPSIAVENAVTFDGWRTGRSLGDREFRDRQHAIAIPYVDYFVTDDVVLTAILKRIQPLLRFTSAKIITRPEFDATFL